MLYVPYVDLLLDRDDRRSVYDPNQDLNTASLVVYLLGLGFSTVVAVHARLIDRRTRMWGREPGRNEL